MDLREWDLIIINTSAGKDSLAMLSWVTQMAKEQGVLDRVHAVHAAFREEWEGTEELAEKQATHYQVPFHKVSRPQGGFIDLVRARGKFPDSKVRLCTSSLKRDQCSKVIRKLRKDLGATKVLNCMGIRAQESPARAKKVSFQKDSRLSTKTSEVWTWYPIFDWTEEQVWKWCPQDLTHPAYKLGMPRLSCVFCIFAPKSALMVAGQHNPELLQEYVDLEEEIGHTFRHKFSIKEVQDELAKQEGPIQIEVESWNM